MASVLDTVKHYQQCIEKYSNDQVKILKCIDKLYHLEVTTQHLQETGVGRTVNALRKDPGEVGTAARSLVFKWKRMVSAEESDHEGDHRNGNDTSMHNGNSSGKESDDNLRQHKSRQDERTHSTTKSGQHRHMNGHSTENKRKYHSSEEEEPNTKKIRHSNIEEEHKKPVVIKKEKQSDSESDDDSDSSDSDSDSFTSESSQEHERHRKNQQEVKVKKDKFDSPERLKSSKSQHMTKHDEHKRDPSSSKQNESERHSNHHSKSKESRHASDASKSSSSSSHKHKSSHDRETSSEKKQNSFDETREKESNKHSSSAEKQKSSSHKQNNHDKHKSSSDSQSGKADKHRSSEKNSDKHRSSSQTDRENEKHRSLPQTDKEIAPQQRSSSHTDKEKEKHSRSSHPDNDREKHRSSSQVERGNEKSKSLSQTDKEHKSSSRSEKDSEKQKSSSESSKHRSKESSSSKDKPSSSSKDKSKDRGSSSKEKSSSHSEKRYSSGEDKSQDKARHTSEDRSGKKKEKSSSSHRSKSSSKSKEELPKKKSKRNNSDENEEGIDCGSGLGFADALSMMISPTKPKKNKFKDVSPGNPFSHESSPAALLAPTAKLAPLPNIDLISALPEISPNYKPRPPPKAMPHFTDEEALSASISSKNQRTKVYSGNKVVGKVTSLYAMCVSVLQEHIDALEYTGGVPYDILKPVIDKATPNQLFVLEHYNPYLMDDTDHLWQRHCEKHFRIKKRLEMETWREMYMRCQEEQESRLKSLTANIRMTQEAKKAPIKQTKMAYVDTVVKPPRNIARKQALHGTAHAATASPAARVASLASGPNLLKSGAPRPVNAAPMSSSAFNKPKKAPLMQKALQFMRGRKR